MPEGSSRDKELVERIAEAHEIAHEKYDHFETVWREIDDVSFYVGIMLGLFLIVFHQAVAFGRSEHKQDSAGVTGLMVSVSIYVGSALGYYPIEVSAVTAMIIAYGQSRKQRADLISWAQDKFDPENLLKPKQLIYPVMVGCILFAHIAT